ncbi:MAG TPA: Uma2 family endonuclease [Bryobacteraceae bacterium]|nr:Uma2 family endonuclease [Bryobacteraceae bacterium]
MSTQPKSFITPEQYLEIERQAEYKSEYLNGEMFAMFGASSPHNIICSNILRELGNQLRKRPCIAYPSDQRVLVPATGLYTYPDVTAVCGEPKFTDDRLDTLLNPSLIIEVLSPSTEAYDRGRKFAHYKKIESLEEYLLVASKEMYADLFRRMPEGLWVAASAEKPEDVLELPSIGCRLVLADIYEKVRL